MLPRSARRDEKGCRARERRESEGRQSEHRSVLPRAGRGRQGDTGASEVASQSRRAGGSRSWPWSSAWGDGTLCAFSREILLLYSLLLLSLSFSGSLAPTHLLTLSLSPSSDQFPSSASSCLLNFPFAGFCVAIEDVAGRRAVRRQCACSTFITIALSLSHARSLSLSVSADLSLSPFLSLTIPGATLFTLCAIKANISIQTQKGRFCASSGGGGGVEEPTGGWVG